MTELRDVLREHLRHHLAARDRDAVAALRTAIALELDGFVALNHTVTASFGVAQLGESGISSALIAADHALYAAKRSGRNAVRLEGGRRRMGGRAARRAADRRTAMRA